MHNKPKIKLLRLVLNLTDTSGAYHLFSIPMSRMCKQKVISLFKPLIKIHNDVDVSDADGSIWKYYDLLREMLKNNQYNVIHAHSPHVGLLLLIALGLSSKKWRIGRIFSVHYSYQHIRFRNRLFLVPIILFFNKIVFCSQASRDSFPFFLKYISRHKYQVVYNGIDIKNIEAIKQHHSHKNNDTFNIISIGRLEKIKRFDKIIAAVKNISVESINLVIVGGGSQMNYLKSIASDHLFKDKITFTGEISREQVYGHLVNANLFVSASTTEGHPVSVLESLAAGCLNLLSDIEPHREIAQNGIFVKLFDGDDNEQLKDEIIKSRSLSPEEHQLLVDGGQQLALEKYSLDNMMSNYLNVYQSVIFNKRARK
jgi:glycosyltransferase involved in cell wall biosynthesis